jgi:two-component system, OmpR family, response regulator MtrA
MAEQTIVITNHDPTYLELIKDMLTNEGYQSVHCIVGTGTHAAIRQFEPALVLLDISFEQPGLGWHLLDMLRLHPATTLIPIIICSADPWLLREKDGLLRTLHCDTLEKPFDLEMLLAKIHAAVGPPLKTVTA